MSLIGKKINDFNVDAFHKNEFIKVSKKDLEGKWNILMFYPADFSFVCPTELEDMAHYHQEFKELDCQVYSVSTDTHFVHKAWHDSSKKIAKIKFPMLADPAGRLAKDFNVLDEELWQALRGSFLINPEGKIVSYEINDMGMGRSAKDMLRKLKAAQFVEKSGGEVCPANWEPGEDTLNPDINLVGKL